MSQQTDADAPDPAFDKAGQDHVEGRTGPARTPETGAATGPAAGPHADPSLTRSDATPGAGSLPSEGAGDDAAAGTG